MKLAFYGATRMVTGSNYMLESGGVKILVDCGLYQGTHYAERENFEPFPYDPKEVQAVFVTHAHLDHVGRLPKLVQDGFRGEIISTPPTRDFAELVLLDSQSILCKDAEREGAPDFCSGVAVPETMRRWKGIPYHTPFRVGPFTVTFYDAGHILGSAIIAIEAEEETIVFSGDLGNYPAPIIRETEKLALADYCVLESTYGDRVHENIEKRQEMLEDVVEDTVRAGGVLLIPAFALERTQELLYQLHTLLEEGRIPKVPVYIDSPLAIKLTEVYKRYRTYFNKATTEEMRHGDDILNFPNFHFTLTTEESKKINDVPPPKIVIAGSGMSHGGRILHHELRYLPDPKSTLLFVGYQAAGSLGRKILDGASEVTIFGERVSVRARRRSVTGYSAHADQPRLLEWLAPLRATLTRVFIVHGEEEASLALAEKIRDELAVDALVPEKNQMFTL